MEKTWTIVKFLKDESVEAVPTSWLLNNTCYWPTYSKEKLIAALRKNEVCNTCWPLLEISVFRNSTYADYLLARRKAKKAEITSDLESEIEESKNRKILKKKQFSSSDSEGSEISEDSGRLPTPPVLKKGTLKVVGKNWRKNSEGAIGLPVKENTKETGETVTSVDLNKDSSTTKNGCTCTCCPVHDSMSEGYFKEILRAQNRTRVQMRQLVDDMQDLKLQLNGFKATDEVLQDESIYAKFEFPLNSEDEFENGLEAYLSNAANFKSAVTEVSKLGGRDTYDFIKRALASLMQNELASKYSWQGAKKKKLFGNLKVAELLMASSRNVFNVSNKESEEAIKKWLRRAKERSEQEKKKMATP